jgi:hypothetical protein
MNQAAPLPCIQSFESIMAALCAAVAARWRYIPEPLRVLIWTRLRRVTQRFVALAERVHAGKYRPPQPRKARAAPEQAQARAARTPPEFSMPRGYGALCPLVPLVANFGGQLAFLLKDPEMAALVASAPQLGKMLRPVLTILAVGDWPAVVAPSREFLRMRARVNAAGTPRAAPRPGRRWGGRRAPDVTGGSDKLSPRWIRILRDGMRRWGSES